MKYFQYAIAVFTFYLCLTCPIHCKCRKVLNKNKMILNERKVVAVIFSNATMRFLSILPQVYITVKIKMFN